MKKLFLCAVALAAASSAFAGDYPFQPADMTNVAIRAGFWLPRFETNRLVTVWADFRKSEETGRIGNFELAGKRAKGGFRGIPFDDSDVFKIVEGAAYTLSTHPDPELEKYLDELIAKFAAAQEEDGYLYTARTLGFNYGTKNGKTEYGMMGPVRWSNCPASHELYNVGHMYEAAVAYYQVTGKRTLLDVAIKNADLVDKVFGPNPDQLKHVPGHEEIELALCKLYRATGEERYLKLAKHFLDQRGADHTGMTSQIFAQSGSLTHGDEMTAHGNYNQNHLPVIAQREAVGHAVRAGYLYCGMADVAALTGNDAYVKAIGRIWENVVGKKLHLNGSIGARHAGEAFGKNYELPNESAYLETCAGIANALWNQRMFLLHGEAKYIDVLERVLYNGFLSGISLWGDEFFYPNPLASTGGYKRSKWFGCSCFPVNVVRFIPQVAQFAYATRANALYVNLFVQSDAKLALGCGEVKVAQTTEYPWEGTTRLAVTPPKAGAKFALNVRVPGWCVGRPVPSDLYTQVVPGTLADFAVKVNGQPFAFTPEKGYCVVDRAWQPGDTVEVAMNMPVRRIKAHDAVEDDRGRLAVERGPIVYCAEGVDNDGHVLNKILPADATFALTTCSILGNVYPALKADALILNRGLTKCTTSQTSLTLVPYFAWCHRGAGEMQTWFPAEADPAKAPQGYQTTVSHVWSNDTPAALSDGRLPKSSGDDRLPRLTFWPHRGTKEWAAYHFPTPETLKSASVYWFDDTGVGNCRVPAAWSIEYREADDAPWQKVDVAYPVKRDGFCTVEFPQPVRAKDVRLVVQSQPNFSSGALEWIVK